MSDPTAVRRAVAIALTEGEPAPPTDPTVQHAAVATARRAPAWQKAMCVRAAALHATAPAVPDAWTAPTDRASDAAAWPR
jgi:hypothetical protein